jgi:hypothetical protein
MTTTDLTIIPGASSSVVIAADGTVWSITDLIVSWLGSYDSPNTRDAYRRDLLEFFAFCAGH